MSAGTTLATTLFNQFVFDSWLFGPRPSPPLPRDAGSFSKPRDLAGFFLTPTTDGS